LTAGFMMNITLGLCSGKLAVQLTPISINEGQYSPSKKHPLHGGSLGSSITAINVIPFLYCHSLSPDFEIKGVWLLMIYSFYLAKGKLHK